MTLGLIGFEGVTHDAEKHDASALKLCRFDYSIMMISF